jgi:hypothetical protein
MHKYVTGLAVLFVGLAAVGCKDKKTAACAHVLVEVAESEVIIQKARDDKDNKLADIGKVMAKESKALRDEKVDDEKLHKIKDKYADALDDYAELYKDKDTKFDEWLKKAGKLSEKRYGLTEDIVEYCKGEKKDKE